VAEGMRAWGLMCLGAGFRAQRVLGCRVQGCGLRDLDGQLGAWELWG